MRTFTALVDVVSKAVASHTNEAVADSVREVLGYQIWDHHIRTVPEHAHESKEEHVRQLRHHFHHLMPRFSRSCGRFSRIPPQRHCHPARAACCALRGAQGHVHANQVMIGACNQCCDQFDVSGRARKIRVRALQNIRTTPPLP